MSWTEADPRERKNWSTKLEGWRHGDETDVSWSWAPASAREGGVWGHAPPPLQQRSEVPSQQVAKAAI
jgi:hypothetical protein